MSFAGNKRELINVLIKIKNPKLLDDFLVDILTPAEMADVIMRWQIVRDLDKGIPQRTIAKKMGLSISKITRGSRMLLNKSGGFNQILRKLKK